MRIYCKDKKFKTNLEIKRRKIKNLSLKVIYNKKVDTI